MSTGHVSLPCSAHESSTAPNKRTLVAMKTRGQAEDDSVGAVLS